MPAFLLPSPTLTDLSFPRDAEALNRIALALGSLEEEVSHGRVTLILTAALQLFVTDFDWSRTENHALLRDIFVLFNQWFLQPHDDIKIVATENIHSCGLHQIPNGTVSAGVVDLWQEDAAKLLWANDEISEESFLLGVACEHAFSGAELGSYPDTTVRSLPLVGPAQIPEINVEEYWDCSGVALTEPISFAKAKKNVFCLGARRVKTPSGGTHYKVYFPNAPRPWVLDYNDDPLPDRYVGQLPALCGYSLDAVKFALHQGSLPRKTSSIEPLFELFEEHAESGNRRDVP